MKRANPTHLPKIAAGALLAAILLAGCAASAPAQSAETEAPPQPTAAQTQPTEVTAASTQAAEAAPAAFEAQITPVITTEQRSVTVTTADEFVAAIAPDTEIVVEAELLDLSQATGYGESSGEWYYWYDEFDGPELRVRNVTNLTIRGSGDDRAAVTISAVPRYADVLAFENCANIHVAGLTAGHTQEPGSCLGGVLHFTNCQDVLVENCGLFGCGTLGVQGDYSKAMQIVNNEIYECSVGGAEFTNCDQVNVDGNTFRDLGGPTFRIFDCGSITCDGQDARTVQ